MTTERLFPYPQGVTRQLLHMPVWAYRVGLGVIPDAAQIMVLTTRGRTTGQPRHTAIEYREHGSKIYVISIWSDRPQWYRNLLRDPEVTVQRGSRICAAHAEPVTNSGEALRVLHLFRRRAPGIYDSIIARLSDRESIDTRSLHEVTDEFTIVRIEPRAGALPLAPVPVSTNWIIPAALIGMSLLVFTGILLLRATNHSSRSAT